jgi:putative PIN family toxin of toxin-antitoxin system
MQKIILDTNVVVSALIQKSFPYLILHDLYIERKIRLCISENLMSEYHDVLKRDKFPPVQACRLDTNNLSVPLKLK